VACGVLSDLMTANESDILSFSPLRLTNVNDCGETPRELLTGYQRYLDYCVYVLSSGRETLCRPWCLCGCFPLALEAYLSTRLDLITAVKSSLVHLS